MQLSIIIVNYNVKHFLNLCLQSVEQATKNIQSEVIVVDNNSSDGSIEFIKNQYPEVILIENKTNVGFAKANNLGTKIAKGNYLLILNPDTVIAEDSLEKLIQFTANNPLAGFVGVQLIDGGGNFLQESKRNIPTLLNSFKKLFTAFPYSKQTYYSSLGKNEVGEVSILPGAFMFAKSSVFKKLRGFDERYFMYAEDIDLSVTALSNGYKNYYVGTIKAIHFKGESTVKNIKQLKYFTQSMHLYFAKYNKNMLKVSIVLLGIYSWQILHIIQRFFSIQKSTKFNKAICISDRIYQNNVFDLTFLKTIQDVSSLANELDNTIDTILLDSNFLSMNIIIDIIQRYSQKGINFKIIPRVGNVLVGNNNKNSRGKIITFQF